MDNLNLDLALELISRINGTRRPEGATPLAAAPRAIAPTGPPIVTQLPNAGTGAAPVVPPPIRAQGPPSPGDLLGGATSGVLGAIGDKLGGGLGAVAQSGPIQAAGSTGLMQALGAGVSAALTGPQGALLENFGEDAYRYVADPNYTRSSLGGAVIQENMPVLRGLMQWARENPEKVKAAHDQGFTDRTGDQQWTGGRAVWEAYAREHLTGNLEGAIAGVLTDPWNLIPGAGRAGGAVRELGGSLARGAVDDATRSALRAATASGVTAGDELAAAATKDLLSGHPFRIQDVLDTISPELGRQFAAGGLRLSSFPNGVEGLARAAAYKAAQATAVPDQGLMRLGRALELGGRAVEAPARLLDEAPSRIVKGTLGGVNRAAEALPLVGPAKSRVGATIGRFFDASPRMQAVRHFNEAMAAKAMRDAALERQRQLHAMLGPEIADMLGPPLPPGITTPPGPPSSTFANYPIVGQRTLADEAEAATGQANLAPAVAQPAAEAAPAPTTATATLERPQAVEPGAPPPEGDVTVRFRDPQGRLMEAVFDTADDAKQFVKTTTTGGAEAFVVVDPRHIDVRPTGVIKRVDPNVSAGGRLHEHAIYDTRTGEVARAADGFSLDGLSKEGAEAQAAEMRQTAPDAGTAATSAAPAAPYREQLATGPSSIERAGDRFNTRFGELRAAADEATLADIDTIVADATDRRRGILQTSTSDATPQRKAVNRVDLWTTEFEAERKIRDLLGDAAPAHINREAGKVAQALDALAWNPDEQAAETARTVLREAIDRSDPQMVGPSIEGAIETAEANRATLPAHTPLSTPEAATIPATIAAPRRPPAPTATEAAREAMTLPPAANGAVEVPVAEIRTDPARFQPRSQLDRGYVDQIANEFDWQNFDPPKLWRDPADNQLYMLKGHHRLAAVKQRGDIEAIPATFFEGSEDDAITFARASNAERPESPLEKAATVRRQYDRAIAEGGLDPATVDETRVLASMDVPGVKPTERQRLLNLSRLPGPIRDDLSVHANAGKAVLDAHAKLGSRIDPHAQVRNGIQTVTPQEAEGLYRSWQKQRRKRPDDPLPDLTAKDINELVDGIDAMTGMSRVEQVGMFAGMTTDDGRAAEFIAANAEMVKRHKILKSRQTTHEKSLGLLESDIAALEAEAAAAAPPASDMFGDTVPVENTRLTEKRQAYEVMRREVDEAALALEDAQRQGMRLTENNKRADDFTDWQLGALFGPTPDDIRRAVKAGGDVAREVWDWTDEAVAQRTAANAENAALTRGVAGEIAGTRHIGMAPIVPQEVTDILARPFGPNSPKYQTRPFIDVADEIETRIVADKQKLLDLLAQPTSTLDRKETAALTKLSRQYGVKTRAQAAAMNPAALSAHELRAAVIEDFAVPTPGRIGRTLDTASTVYSALNLLMPWTVGRYFMGNMMGDTWQVLLAHGPEAAVAANNPRNIAAMMNYAVRGGDPLVGALGDTVKAAGLGGYHRRLVTENLAESIIASEASAVRRAGGRAKFNWIGDVAHSKRNPVILARNVVNGMEWAHRTALWGFHFRTRVINAKAPFAEEMGELALKNGIAPDEVLRVMDLLNPVVDGSEVADTFARLAGARGRTVQEAAGFGEEMGRKWASKVYQSSESALGQVDDALFSYAQTNADAVLRRIVPFHWWMSRAIPFYAEQMIRHPGFAGAYYRMFQATREQAEAEGWPATMQMFLKAFDLPGGMMLFVNPLAAMGVLDTLVEQNGGYTDENVSAIGRVLEGGSQFGFGLLPWWGAALNHLGYLGDSPFGLDPIGLHQTRNFVGSITQLLGGEGALGDTGQALQPKPYEQMLRDVRDHLSSFGLPGSYHIATTDPNAMPAVMIRNIMLRTYLESIGLDHNQYLALGMRAQEDPTSPEAVQLEQINDAIADDEMDAGPLYRAAVKDYSRANAEITGIKAFVPGPTRTRQEEALATQALSRALNAPVQEGAATRVLGGGLGPTPVDVTGVDYDATIELGIDANDQEFARQWKQKFGETYKEGDLERMRQAAMQANQEGNAPAETAPLLSQQNAYYVLGSDKARKRLEIYNDIRGGTRQVVIPSQDIRLAAYQVNELDEDSRAALADAWLEVHDDDGQAEQLRELRRLYEDTHPEWGAYQQWQRDTRKQWGGARNFRMAAARANPNYAEFIQRETNKLRADGATPNEILSGLDSAALGMNAYMAYQGLRSSRYDPQPRDTGTPLPVASEGAPLGALGGGESGTYQSWDDRVRAAIAETDTAVGIANTYVGGNIMQIPGYIRDSIMAQPDFPSAGQMPADAWIYEDYINFIYEKQRTGGDASIESFIASTRQKGDSQNTPVVPYQPNTWPPVAVAS